MKAVVTVTFWAEVENEENAADLAMEAETSGRLNIISMIEQAGADVEDLEGRFGFLGVSYWLIDEDRVMS